MLGLHYVATSMRYPPVYDLKKLKKLPSIYTVFTNPGLGRGANFIYFIQKVEMNIDLWLFCQNEVEL
jgi:hypothetical protein